MSYVSVSDSVLSLTTTVGFAVKDWQGVAIASATAETVLGFFFPPQQAATATQVFAVRDQIMDALVAQGQAILGGVWQDFSDQYLASVRTAQDTYSLMFTEVLNIPAGQDPHGPTRLDEDKFKAWTQAIGAQTGSTSPLLDACHFVALRPQYQDTSINLYVLSASIFLSYCKMGLLLELLQLQADYQATNGQSPTSGKPLPPPPDSYADLKTSWYYGLLTTNLGAFLGYAKPIVATLTANFASLDAALEKRARDFTLQHDSDGWYYRDGRTGTTGDPTDKGTAQQGMDLEIGIAQSSLKQQLLTQYGMLTVDREETENAAKAINELEDTANDFPPPTGNVT